MGITSIKLCCKTFKVTGPFHTIYDDDSVYFFCWMYSLPDKDEQSHCSSKILAQSGCKAEAIWVDTSTKTAGRNVWYILAGF